jgi:hypothetical protein
MKSLQSILLSLIIFVGFSVHADGVMQLKGKVLSFTETTISISDGHARYNIDKSKLTPEQKKKTENVKFGQDVSIAMSLNAVSSVEDIKQPKKK